GLAYRWLLPPRRRRSRNQTGPSALPGNFRRVRWVIGGKLVQSAGGGTGALARSRVAMAIDCRSFPFSHYRTRSRGLMRRQQGAASRNLTAGARASPAGLVESLAVVAVLGDLRGHDT